MNTALGIFVSTPTLSAVKPCLAREVGRLRAEAFYLSCAEAIASVAVQASTELGIAAYWVIAESRALNDTAWADLPRLPQGPGSLGPRMANVYRLLLDRHGSVLLVGVDAPQLDR
ncbi:DUF2064 domain-containing protein, partial [Dokdonella sp.]|uniref:DUF2064 domain-containing protein n=1 Tax=Dokdonella sp. TaxID=2291710 RepID=UPI003C5CE273